MNRLFRAPQCLLAFMAVAASDQLEQHTGFGLILTDVDDVIKDLA
jgi:hypothetical protein